MGEETKLIEKWYICDNNNVPPISILQPIDTHLKNFLNKKEPTFQAKDAAAWWVIQSKLQGTFPSRTYALGDNCPPLQ